KKLKYILQYNELKMAINNIQNLESNLWLENENGEIVSDNNASGTADTIKTLRAIYSGYKIDLIFESKSGVYHFFKVNIKTEK
ncbi:MAG: hypothetical protein U9N53_14590, partial [Bacteroidota bacterium]|nr:hypothetical protein [Bacteroidota bacterium]